MYNSSLSPSSSDHPPSTDSTSLEHPINAADTVVDDPRAPPTPTQHIRFARRIGRRQALGLLCILLCLLFSYRPRIYASLNISNISARECLCTAILAGWVGLILQPGYRACSNLWGSCRQIRTTARDGDRGTVFSAFVSALCGFFLVAPYVLFTVSALSYTRGSCPWVLCGYMMTLGAIGILCLMISVLISVRLVRT